MDIKVFLVDDKEIFREGLGRLLQEQPDIKLVGQYKNDQRTAGLIKSSGPDVLLMDMDATCRETLESIRQLSLELPDIRIAVLTDSREKEKFITAMQTGARGYLSKNMPVEELIDSIKLIAGGEMVISAIFSEQFIFPILRNEKKKSACLKSNSGLSAREIEILRLITGGASNREIAENLFITENTVKVHLKNILDKLQLRNRQQLSAYAIQLGLTMVTNT